MTNFNAPHFLLDIAHPHTPYVLIALGFTLVSLILSIYFAARQYQTQKQKIIHWIKQCAMYES